MKLSLDETREVNHYLAQALRALGFDVVVGNKFGNIKKVSRFNVRCMPGICHSVVDGKQEYSYLCLSSGKTDSSDFGYYCTDNDCSLTKYSNKEPVKLNMRTYKRVVDKFASDLNQDYIKLVKSQLKESANGRVRIKNPDDVFNGKTGVIESDKGELLTIIVDFDDKGHKIRHDLRKEFVEMLDETKKMNEATSHGNDFETVDDEVVLVDLNVAEEKRRLVAKYFNVPVEDVTLNTDVSKYSDSEFEVFRNNVYTVYDRLENSLISYVVMTGEEVEFFVRQQIEFHLNTFGLRSQMFAETLLDYVDADVFDNIMKDTEQIYVDELSDEEVFREAYYTYLLLDKDPLVNAYENNKISFSELRDLLDLDIEDLRESIFSIRCDWYESGVLWYIETYGEDEFFEFLENNPSAYDKETLIADIIFLRGMDNFLDNRYNDEEYYLGVLGGGVDVYMYRLE